MARDRTAEPTMERNFLMEKAVAGRHASWMQACDKRHLGNLMASPTIARLSQSRPYICRQCVSQISALRRQFSAGRALQRDATDETNGNVLELLEARGYIKEIAGLATQHFGLHYLFCLTYMYIVTVMSSTKSSKPNKSASTPASTPLRHPSILVTSSR